MAFHCTNCNGSVLFDVALQQMRCEHCGSTFDPEEFVVRDEGILTCKACGTTIDTKGGTPKFCPQCGEPFEDKSSVYERQEGAPNEGSMARFTCQSCGAELEGTDDSMIGFCPYCAGQSLIKEQGGHYTVESIVPFQVDKEHCVELYSTYTKGVRFLPAQMRDPAFIQKFTGIYMPFFQYDVQIEGAELTGQKTVISTPRYDEIHHYSFEVTPQDEYERGVTFDGSRYLDDEISERVQPFDQGQRRAFSPAYLAGFYADTSTVDAELYNEDASAQAAENLVDMAAEHMRADRGITVHKEANRVQAHTLRHHSVLYPLWFLTWRRDERVAYAVINGESGEVVSDLPLDLRSFAITCAIVSAALFAVLEFLFQPTPLVTSLISLAAALLMGHGIRSGAQQEYERQVHANDKGWTGAGDEGGKKKKRGTGTGLKTVLTLAAILAISTGISIARGSASVGGILGILRMVLPLACIIYAIYVGIKVLTWHKHIKNRDALLGVIALVVTVILNAAIVLISPVNDGWYYLGDAVCILGLVLTAVAMIRLYNLGTTRPLPKLFDRKEVSS